MTKRAVLLSLAAMVAATATAHGEGRRLTFAEAIDLTITKNPDLAGAKESADAAKAHAASTRSKRFPALSVDAIGNYYREAYSVPFGPESFTLHEQRTSFTNVRLTQPLTGLAYLSELVGSATHEAAAASADYDRARLDVTYATAEAYLRALQAHATADVAHRTVADITAELEQAQKLRAADAATNIDVLRLQSTKAAADQAAVRADSSLQIALAQLAVTIGLPDGAALDITDDLPATPPTIALSLEQAIARGISARPELRAAREHIAAADNLVTSKKELYLPNVNAVGVYTHSTGVEPFQPANEEYVGLQVQWNVWNWGGTHDDISEAEHQRARAKLAAGSLAEHVRLDVRTRWLDAKAGLENLASAQTQVQAAEEAYRLTHVKYESSAATTTDVLDAETEVARARLRSALSRYDYYLALVALARAVGDIPSVK
jgi:outer membrane protein